MAGRIPENILEGILSRIDIAEVILEFMPLKRAGRNFKAICPFHHEKTPSFMVSSDKQIYHCFGCGAGGNAFNFLMQHERIEFIEAVEILAKRAGVALPEIRKEQEKVCGLTTQIYQINELAAKLYQDNLAGEASLPARNYLLKRGVRPETLKLFKLGYAPEKWDFMLGHLRSKGISLSLMEKAGLVVPKEGGGYYDRFRNRIIFPVCDIKSRVIGFGARIMDASLPKYINSPETPLYFKGRNLYGLNLSKDEIRRADCAVVVEGYLDFISVYQQGLANIVASSGTALTGEQARLIKRYTRNVIMVYDGDKAGEMAMTRSLDIFIEENMDVRVVSLPQGFDPDLFVRKNGIANFKARVRGAENLFNYKLRVLKARHNIKEIEGKAMIASEMLPTINKFKNALLKSEYLKRLSGELNVREEALLEEMGKIKEYRPNLFLTEGPFKKSGEVNPTEKLLLKLMLEEGEVVNRLKERIEPADFQDERTSRVVSLMFNLNAEGKQIESKLLLSHFGDSEISRLICESTFMPDVPPQEKDKIIDDCIMRLKHKRMHVKKQHLHEEIKIAQELGDEKRLKRLMEEFQQLIKTR